MKAILLLSGSGALAILTSHQSVTEPALLNKLADKGLDKFVAFELPLELTKERYGGHFDVVLHDLHETNDLRILDTNGARAFDLFTFDELESPIFYEKPHAIAA